ncbi:MAG: V-type ATPase 116kDa subunit family protein, partial [Candidatus Ranarchaeia archaeon]
KKKFEELGLQPDNVIDEATLLPGNTIREILSNIEQKLTEIEEQSNPIIELLNLDSILIKKTLQKLQEWKGSPKKLITKNTPPANRHSSEEVLDQATHNLIDINNHLEETAKQVLEFRSREYSEENSIQKGTSTETIHSTLSALNIMTLEVDVLLEAENNMAHCDTIVYFEAWILKKQLSNVTNGIEEITSGKCVIELEKPRSEDNVPNVIKHHPKVLEGFESLTFSLGYPRKGEINPTYLMAITFPFLFGIMFADVGQGLILFIGGILLLIMRGRVDLNKVGEIPRGLLRAAGVIALCGISAMIFGYLFGEFFGPSGVLHPVLLFKIGPFKFGGFDPMHEPLTLLRFTILIGVSFISFSLFIGIINYLKRRELVHAFTSFCWVWFLIGGFFMWVFWGGISQITTWFGRGLPMFFALVITPLIIMLIVVAKAESLMEGANTSVEIFIESLGHTLSFCRLAALFLTHTALSSMFLDLAGVENGYFPLSSIPIIAIGAILSLSIEGLLVMVHCLRLHWIELLPKYYSAKGILFEPINLKNQNLKHR